MNQQYSDYHLPMHAYPGIIYQPVPQPIPQPVASSSSAHYMGYNADPSHHYAQQASYGALPMQTITPQMLQGSSGSQMPSVPSFGTMQPSFPQNNYYANEASNMHYGYTGVLPTGGSVAGPSSMTPESVPLLEQGKNGSGSNSSKDAAGEKGGVGKWKNEKEKEKDKDKDKEGPVKNACLSCRTKKAKCDGAQPVCGQCEKKNLECVFVKSRRGGARKKREVPPPTALQDFLKKLDTLMSIQESVPSPPVAEPNDDPTNVVRTFASRQEILKCYYEEVHPFLPVMPPKRHLEEILPTLAAESPFILATKTILVLAPHPNDPAPKSTNSKRLRQLASNELSKQTMELVSSMLAEQSTIECVQALAMLSMWEWASAGSLSGNRARAGQAVQVAMEMGLHELDKHKAYTGVALEGEDWRKDMARRTWWTVYVAQLTASMVGGTTPVVGADDSRIMVDFPVCSLQDRAWPNWVNANRYCLRIFALINQAFYGHGAAAVGWGSPGSSDSPDVSSEAIHRKVLETDQQVMELMKQAEASAVIDLVPGGEEEVVRNQQLSTRLGLSVTHIHIHRQQAFPEVSLFSKRICGLPQAPDFITPNAENASLPGVNGAADLTNVKAEGDQAFSLTEGYGDYQTRANGQTVPGSVTLGGGAGGNASSVSLTHESSGDSATRRSDAMLYTSDSGSSHGHGHGAAAAHNGGVGGLHPEYDFIDEMWQPETFPEMLPAPWFTHAGGAAALYQPIEAEPQHVPALTATIRPVTPSYQGAAAGMALDAGYDRRGSMASMQSFAPSATSGVPRSTPVRTGPQKAWGVDAEGKAVAGPSGSADSGSMQVFPPGISLARCATAAHTIVRLEVLHRSAVIAMWNGPPKWLPFCACGLVTGAYAFLLLALAVQAESSFGIYDESKAEEIEALLTNVRVLLAGLEAYGVMWAGIEIMANEVRAALEAASRLPSEVRAQIHNASLSPPDQPYQPDSSA